MKITELIKKLKEVKKKNGDIECEVYQPGVACIVANVDTFTIDEDDGNLLIS